MPNSIRRTRMHNFDCTSTECFEERRQCGLGYLDKKELNSQYQSNRIELCKWIPDP